MLHNREYWKNLRVSTEIPEVFVQSWRPGARSKYHCYIKQLEHFFVDGGTDPFKPTRKIISDFFHTLFK